MTGIAAGGWPGGDGSRDTDARVAPLHLVDVAARPEVLASIRHVLAEWAAAAGLPAEDVDDLVIATYEAMANVLDHAYEPSQHGCLTVRGTTRDDTVEVVVRDSGRWRPTPDDPGYRGRGLMMIRRLAHHVDLHSDDEGTTVVMTWYRHLG